MREGRDSKHEGYRWKGGTIDEVNRNGKGRNKNNEKGRKKIP